MLCFLFFFYCYGDHRDLHSFPTRRSSDLFQSHGCRWIAAGQATVRNNYSHQSGPGRICSVRWLDQRSEEHTSELQSHHDLVCRLLLEKKKNKEIEKK